MKLKKRLNELAEKYGVTVVIGGGSQFEIELEAPDGFCFEPETHILVNSQWDHDTVPTVYRSAIDDLERYGPLIQKCPDDCPCKEVD
jgi:hypothetical protein